MKFTMTIDSENEAVVDYPTKELQRALRKVSSHISASGVTRVDGGVFLDINGNTIGSWEVTP